MEPNILERVTAQIDLITIDKAEAEQEEHNPQEFLEEICCRNTKREECPDHFLNTDLMYFLHDGLKSRNPNRVYGTAYFVADMAKNETSREFLSNIYLVCLLVDKMKSEGNYYIRLQVCRALANMCYENCKTQRLIAGQNPLDDLFNFLELPDTPFEEEKSERFKEVVVALALNLMSDNERVLREIAEKYIPVLIRTLEWDLQKQEPSSISHNMFVAIATAADLKPSENVFTVELCEAIVDMYRRTSVFDYTIQGLEFLEDAELPDITKYQLAQCGIFEVFMLDLETKPGNLPEEENRKYELIGRVMANILSGDEAMIYIFGIKNADLLNRYGAFLLSEDPEMIHTGALCLGNLARTDAHSCAVVQRGIHKNLLRVVQQTRDVRLLYAAVSTLRNVCLPVANKKELIKDGMLDALFPLLDLEVRASSPVIYKAIGAVRQVMDGEVEINIRIGSDGNLIRQLVNWARTTLLPWVSTECSRFLISLVNVSKDRGVIITLIESGAYAQMSRMLAALHGLMQSEALSCMTKTVKAALDEAKREDLSTLSEEEKKKSDVLINVHSVFIECELAEKMKHLISQHGVKMEQYVVEEFLTFLEEAIKIEQLRTHLYYEGFKGVFHYVMRNREDYEQIKARVEQIENACKFS